MNVLFLTLLGFESLNERNIYTDLLREFVKNGHCVYVVSPTEKKEKIQTHLKEEAGVSILRLRIGNMQKTNIIEKGISTLTIEPIFKRAIKKYFVNVRFDMVLYSTPPITFVGVIRYIKKRDKARTYLLLKDIFPQNAIDIGIMRKNGFWGLIYNHFRKKEMKLYKISDNIGCMSEANKQFVLKNNPYLDNEIVEICPNSIEPFDISKSDVQKHTIRDKYNIPNDKMVFFYGGNLGKIQSIDYLINCLSAQEGNEKVFFLIVGNGTDYYKLKDYVDSSKQENVRLISWLCKEDHDQLMSSCDIGMIIIDYKFTIPNFPSRLLGYMQAKLPVLCVTDRSTDIGDIAVRENFGWKILSNSVQSFTDIINIITNHTPKNEIRIKGNNGYNVLLRDYDVKDGYNKIIEKNRR